jgi:hypothetical protein
MASILENKAIKFIEKKRKLRVVKPFHIQI